MCETEYFEFYSGEKRYIEGSVLPQKQGETVIINSATYKLSKAFGDEVIYEGKCDINGGSFSVLLDFLDLTAGEYSVRFTLSVGGERVVEKVGVSVKG